MWMRSLCLVAMSLTLSAGLAAAQDAHYWNKQYGNRAYMLGGAVIGSSDDVSAVYYNPALLTISARPNLTVAGNAFYTTSITLQNALGEELDLTSSSIGTVPSLVAGEIPLGHEGDRRLAYSLLFRQDFDFLLEQRGQVALPGVPAGAETRVSLEETGSEIWSGLSYARRLDARLSVGASVYATYRTHRTRRHTLTAAETDEEFGIVALRNDFDYTHIGLLAKFGAGGRSGPWRYGVTVTTPSLRLAGSGTRSFDRVLAGGDLDGGQLEAETITDIQSDLESNYRNPLAVGAGLAYRLSRTTFHLAAEWFDEVPPYRLLDAERVLDEDTGEPIDLDLVTSSRSIVNFGLGLEHEFGHRVHGYLGFHTDRSAAGEGDLQNQLAIWDIHHASGGVSLNFGDKRVAVGAVYAFGDEPLPGTLDLVPADPDGDDPARLPQDIEASYRSFLLLIGFDVNY